MTGKLDIGRGDEYGFYPKLARQHAELVAHHHPTHPVPHAIHAGSDAVDVTSIPETGSNGVTWVLKFKTGGNQQTTGAVDGNASRADVIRGLIAQTAQLTKNGLIGTVTTDGNFIYIPQGVLGAVTEGVVESASGTTNPAPPPDFVQGPYTANGKAFWIQREGGVWYVWFDAAPDGQPDTRQRLDAYLADPTHAPYEPGIRTQAEALGWVS